MVYGCRIPERQKNFLYLAGPRLAELRYLGMTFTLPKRRWRSPPEYLAMPCLLPLTVNRKVSVGPFRKFNCRDRRPRRGEIMPNAMWNRLRPICQLGWIIRREHGKINRVFLLAALVLLLSLIPKPQTCAEDPSNDTRLASIGTRSSLFPR